MKTKLITAALAFILSTTVFASDDDYDDDPILVPPTEIENSNRQRQGQAQGQISENRNRNDNEAEAEAEAESYADSDARAHNRTEVETETEVEVETTVGVETGDVLTTVETGPNTLTGAVTDNSALDIDIQGDTVTYEAAKIPVQTAYAGPGSKCYETAGVTLRDVSISGGQARNICDHLTLADQYILMAQTVATACVGDACMAKVGGLMDSAMMHMATATEVACKHRPHLLAVIPMPWTTDKCADFRGDDQ